MKAPEISITVTDLTLRFPVYGVDSKSLKKHLARITVGGKLGKTGLGAPEITALSKVNLQLRSGDRLGLIAHNGSARRPCCGRWPAPTSPTRAPSTCTARSPPCST